MAESAHGRSRTCTRVGLGDRALGLVATKAGAYRLHADGAFTEGRMRVTAVIYDRFVSPSRGCLDMRLHACRTYAAQRGWTVAAEHVDTWDATLPDRSRPGLDAAVEGVRKAANDPSTDQAVLLVHNHGRLSHNPLDLAFWRQLVAVAGGIVATVERGGHLFDATLLRAQ